MGLDATTAGGLVTRRVVAALRVVLLFGVALAAVPLSAVALTPVGISQLSGTDACVSGTGSGGDCADGRALAGASGVAVSPDGLHVYVASYSGAVAAFSRNAQTGALSQLAGTDGCVSETGSGGACVNGKALGGARDVAVSPDGQHVYVVSQVSNAVAVFARNVGSGALSQLSGTDGCVSESGSGGACADGKALDGVTGVAISPDGRNVYVASQGSDGVAVFRRDPATGVLTQLAGTAGCVSDNGSGGSCVDGRALEGARSVVVSQDGKHVYVAAADSDAIAAFRRSKVDGRLEQLAGVAGCVSQTGSGGECTVADRVDATTALAMATKGKTLFFTSFPASTLGALKRNKKSGALTQLTGAGRCVSEDGSGGACIDGRGLAGAAGVAASPASREVYVAGAGGVAALSHSGKGKLVQAASASACVSNDGSGGACADGKALIAPLGAAVSPDGRHIYIVSVLSSAVASFARQ